MMTEEELLFSAEGLRARRVTVDEELIIRIESDVMQYREFLGDHRGPTPPDKLVRLLPVMGWLIYEASLWALQRVATAFELLDNEQRHVSDRANAFVRRLADVARHLPWPEFAPRALGAVRAQALASSKRDTESGYDAAWVLHQEVRQKLNAYRDSLGEGLSTLALDEITIQLALAETGTACRAAERVISRWSEGLAAGDWRLADESRWVQRMFRELTGGISYGEEALALVKKIDDGPGLVGSVTHDRLALKTAYTMPAIMTARAALLALALTSEMEDLGRIPPGPYEFWDDMRDALLERIKRAYEIIERPFAKGHQMPLTLDSRSLVQVRLTIALLAPEISLPSRTRFDPCMALNPLDTAAVEALSSWLAAKPDGGHQRGDANAIGSATMPSFIRSVESCRATFGVIGGYREWRKKWMTLDRYADEPGRRDRVDESL